MQLSSTFIGKQIGDDDHCTFSLGRLLEIDGAIRSATIISAYTDIDMLVKVRKLIRKNRDKRSGVRIRVFLDRLSSTYESNDSIRKRLNKFAECLNDSRYYASGSGIWLVKTRSLFHSKAVVLETNTMISYMVGSLNMTCKAFSRNEELVAIGKSTVNSRSADTQIANWISETYCAELEKESTSIQVPFAIDCIQEQDSMQSLLLSGVMYHDLKETDPFRFAIAGRDV